MRKGRGGNRTIKADEASAFAKRGLSSRPASSGQKSPNACWASTATSSPFMATLSIRWTSSGTPKSIQTV